MSGIDWNGILRLPEAALAGCRRIPKTVLVKQAMLTKTEQKRLDKVARLEHFATVQKSTTRIPPYEDDERNVQSVVFLRCEMTAGTMAVAEVAELVHKCFPNPTVLLVEAGGCACISVALTRRSQAEQGATVVVIEHDLDVIANADYVVDLGPGGGASGGRIVAVGTPEQVADNPESVTGRYL